MRELQREPVAASPKQPNLVDPDVVVKLRLPLHSELSELVWPPHCGGAGGGRVGVASAKRNRTWSEPQPGHFR